MVCQNFNISFNEIHKYKYIYDKEIHMYFFFIFLYYITADSNFHYFGIIQSLEFKFHIYKSWFDRFSIFRGQIYKPNQLNRFLKNKN